MVPALCYDRAMTQAASRDLEQRVALLEGWKESQEPFVRSLKDDIREVQTRLAAFQAHVDHRFSDLEAAMGRLREELRGEIAQVRGELRGEIAQVREELGGEIAGLRREMREENTRLVERMDTQTRWIVGVQFLTLLTLIAALLRLAG